jgi:hypothetical protein
MATKTKLSASTRKAGASLVKKVTGVPVNTKHESEVGMQSPWVVFHKGLFNLLNSDPDLSVENTIRDCGHGLYESHISSYNYKKLTALKKILKTEIDMGNITVRVVFDYEAPSDTITAEDWKTAFDGNPLFKGLVNVPITPDSSINYAIFAREILTYFVDDLTDIYGNRHIIVADLVKQLSNETAGINVCTETFTNEYNGEVE